MEATGCRAPLKDGVPDVRENRRQKKPSLPRELLGQTPVYDRQVGAPAMSFPVKTILTNTASAGFDLHWKGEDEKK